MKTQTISDIDHRLAIIFPASGEAKVYTTKYTGGHNELGVVLLYDGAKPSYHPVLLQVPEDEEHEITAYIAAYIKGYNKATQKK